MERSEALATLTAPGAFYELEEIELYGQRCRAFRNAPPTLRELYERNRSDLPFLVHGEERSSYEDAWRRACHIAKLLVEQYGIEKGDRVAISARNYPEWMLAFSAVTSVGGIAVAMNSHWQPDELAYGLQDSGAKVLFADEERLERLAPRQRDFPELGVLSLRAASHHGVANARSLEIALAEVDTTDTMPAADFLPEDDAIILYTSGSTGHPKGAVSCHRSILTALLSWELDVYAGLLMQGRPAQPGKPVTAETQQATLLAVPLFHATGTHAVYLASYRAQRRIVCMRKWDVDQAAELIERERITTVFAPPAMTGDLVEAGKRSQRDLSSLAVVGGGGAPRAPEQVRGIDQTFRRARPNTGWGMTETNAIGTGISGRDYLERPESSGRCSAVLELRVVDEQGRTVPTGAAGELQVRGTSVFRGYWERPDANAETFTEDRWMRTGDVAKLDEDGYLTIVDRIKDLVIRGGENIGCGAVEAALLEHPRVLEVSVYGVPDARLGEELAATVYAEDTVDETELRDFLAPRLARFEIPRYFRFARTPLPRTASGKILKRQLREEAVAALG